MSERIQRWAWPVGAVTAALLARLPSLGLLLDRDEGEFASLAWLWRSGHGLPYRDYLEQKPPLTLLPHAVAQALAPADGVVALRWISLFWTLATVLAVYAFMLALARGGRLGPALQRLPQRSRAVAGAAALAAGLLFSSAGTQALAANTESWQTLPLLGALALAFVDERPGLGRWLACGALLGLASLFKQPAVIGVLWLPWAAADRSTGKALVATTAGAALAWAAAWLPFAWLGAGPDLIHCTLAYNQAYVLAGQPRAWGRAMGLVLHLAPELSPAVVLAGLGLWRLRREGARLGWLLAWSGVGLVSLAASGRYYPHYAILLLGPLGVLAGVGALAAWDAACAPLWRGVAALAAAGALSAWALGQAPIWRASSGEQRTWELYHVTSFATAPQAAARLQQLCPPDKRLFLWGDDAEIFYLSRLAPATRFLFTYPFTGEAPSWPLGQQEMEAALADPRTGAAAMARPLVLEQGFQAELGQGLQAGYHDEHAIPGWVLGARR
jgi:hypothetical protein